MDVPTPNVGGGGCWVGGGLVVGFGFFLLVGCVLWVCFFGGGFGGFVVGDVWNPWGVDQRRDRSSYLSLATPAILFQKEKAKRCVVLKNAQSRKRHIEENKTK